MNTIKPAPISFWCEKCWQLAQWEAHRIPGREYMQITVTCHDERVLIDLDLTVNREGVIWVVSPDTAQSMP